MLFEFIIEGIKDGVFYAERVFEKMEFIIEEVNKSGVLTRNEVFEKKIKENISIQRQLLKNISANILKEQLLDIYKQIQRYTIGDIIAYYSLLIVFFEGVEKTQEFLIRDITRITCPHLKDCCIGVNFDTAYWGVSKKK